MRQDHYNVGLHTLDSLATIVSIGLEISAKLYRPTAGAFVLDLLYKQTKKYPMQQKPFLKLLENHQL